MSGYKRNIRVKYEPERSRAGVVLPTLVAITVNGIKRKRRPSSEMLEFTL